MASEVELERLIVRLMGEGSSYQKMLADATSVTDQLGQEMKRLGGTEAEFSAITARAAAVTNTATEALGRHSFEASRLRGLLTTGRLSVENFNMLMGSLRTTLGPTTAAIVQFNQQIQRGAQVTKSSETIYEAYNRKIAELDKLVDASVISQQTYNRVAEGLNAKLPRTIAFEQQRALALKQAAAAQKQLTDAISQGAAAERQMIGRDQRQMVAQATRAAAEAERELTRVRREGQAITQSVMTATERYSASVANVSRLLQQGAISQQTYNRAVTAAQTALREATTVTSTLGREISRAGLSLRGFGTSWSIYVTAPLTAFLAASTMAGVKMDSLTRGLTAITHSSAKTQKQIIDMLEVAKLPGLGFKEAMEGNIRLQATGFSASLAKRSLLSFGNALATVGKGKADLDGIILALTQISAKGKVMAQEINQLGERVPQIRKIMEQAFGTADTEKIQKMGLSSKDFIEMIVEELEKLPKVTGGALNDLENLADAAFISFSKVGESVLEVLVPAVKFATSLIYDLGDTFVALPGSVRLATIAIVALTAVIGPIAIIAGQATIAIGGLVTAYTALTASAAGTAALFGTILVSSVLAFIAVAGLLIYELTGARAAYQELNTQMKESKRLSDELAMSTATYQQKILDLAASMEGAAKKDFLKSQLEMADKNLAGLKGQLEAAQAELDKHTQTFTGGASTISKWTGEYQTAQRAVEDATLMFKAQDETVQKLNKMLAAAEYPDRLDTIRQQTMLTKETDTYIKSLERKIETLARGEAATKLADLASRHAALGMKFNADQIQMLIDKEEELKAVKAAKTEATKLAKDVDTLTAKLEAQVKAFGGVKYATDIQALSDRGAADTALEAAAGYSKKLDALKKAADLADDVQKLNDKLAAEVKELKSGTESSEIFALSHRGAKDTVLEVARALEIEKKALKEAADLEKDITTFTDNLKAQVMTFGMASEAADIFKFSLRGATDTELTMTRVWADKKKALEDNKKLMEEAKKVNEKFDPKIKFINEYTELNKMLKAGAISTEVFQKATKDLQADLLKAHDKADVRVRFTVEGNEAVRAGSAEFIKMISDVERRSKDVAVLSGLSGAMSEIDAAFTATGGLGAVAGAAPGGGGFFSVAPEDVSSTPVATTISETESDATLNGEKTLTLLGRIADGIDDIADNPGIVLNGMGTF